MNKATKKKTKKASDKLPAKPAPQGPTRPAEEADEAKPFDFGGLPDRDLKKSLGCGS